MICKVLRPFVNILTDHDKYSLLNRDNFTQPIEMKLAQKQKTCYQFYSLFLKSTFNFQHFQKKNTLITDVFPKLGTPKNVVK